MDREILTKKEYEMYKYIKDNNIKRTGSMEDFARIFGKDKSVICRRLQCLEKKGYIIRNGDYIEIKKE